MQETKNPCKHYTSKESAQKATLAMATKAANYFATHSDMNPQPAQYIVFEVEGLGWVGAICLTELLRRPGMSGGYLGFCTGFFTY